jgi:hypothetical protein
MVNERMGAGKTRPASARLCSAAAVVSEDKRVDEKHGLERAIVVGRGIIIYTTGVDDIPIDCRFFSFKGSDRSQ